MHHHSDKSLLRQGYVVQGALILLLVGAGWFLKQQLSHNLAERDIASGFGFLSQPAGFTVIQSLISFGDSATYFDALLLGILNTLLVASVGLILASIFGYCIGMMRISPSRMVRQGVGGLVTIVRNTPLLLQLLVWYHCLIHWFPHPKLTQSIGGGVWLTNRGLYLPKPNQLGIIALMMVAVTLWWALKAYKDWFKARAVNSAIWPCLTVIGLVGSSLLMYWASFELPVLRGLNLAGGIVLIPEYLSLVLGLSVYTGVFIGELIRSSVQSVPKGQFEASIALGLPRSVMMSAIIYPQAKQIGIPPITSQYLNLIKNSSLAAAIGYPDLVAVFAGTVLTQTGQAIEIIAITMSIYLIMSLLTAFVSNWRLKRVPWAMSH